MKKTEINLFLETLDRSPKTIFAYRNGLEQFVKVVGEDAELNTNTYVKFLVSLKQKSPSTQMVYTTAVLNFYAFCKVGNWAELKEATAHKNIQVTQRYAHLSDDELDMGYYEIFEKEAGK